jgi:predicted membrane chloride channel (bestrophin family)
MKKTVFITLFISTHIGFFFLHIHKHMQFIKESFTKQKYEQALSTIAQKKQARLNELYALQNKQDVKAYATRKLALKPVSMTQLHRFSYEQS